MNGFGANAQARVRIEKRMTVQTTVCLRPMTSLIAPTPSRRP
jgi:hypothetical protein